MNADLPIAFDGWGRMEVDLLCVDSRVVVEVDGGCHLADPVAYRRDRRKDQLGKELDTVLDAILRALASRRTPVVTAHAVTVMPGSRA